MSTLRRMLRGLLIAGLLVLLGAAPAAARPPKGDWTSVRKDTYVHYACKVKRGDRLTVRTATWINGRDDLDLPAYVAIASGPKAKVRDASIKHFTKGFARHASKGVRGRDHLWMQSDGYGPPDVWGDGIRVARLTTCAG